MSRHEPSEHRINTVTVNCAANGPLVDRYEEESARCATLADLEAFCADLRQYGAPDDTAVRDAVGLTVTLDVSAR